MSCKRNLTKIKIDFQQLKKNGGIFNESRCKEFSLNWNQRSAVTNMKTSMKSYDGCQLSTACNKTNEKILLKWRYRARWAVSIQCGNAKCNSELNYKLLRRKSVCNRSRKLPKAINVLSSSIGMLHIYNSACKLQ